MSIAFSSSFISPKWHIVPKEMPVNFTNSCLTIEKLLGLDGTLILDGVRKFWKILRKILNTNFSKFF